MSTGRAPPITLRSPSRSGIPSLVLSTHDHLLAAILLVDDLLVDPVQALLLRLHNGAAQAAAALHEVGDAGSFEVVLLAHVLHLHGLHDPVGAEARGEVEAQAL